MNISSTKTWFSILVFITLAAYAVSSVAAFGQTDLYSDSWIDYGSELVVIATHDQNTDNMKVVIIYYGFDFISLSNFMDAFEETIDVTLYDLGVSDTENLHLEMIGYMAINGVPWMATWTADGGYTFKIAE